MPTPTPPAFLAFLRTRRAADLFKAQGFTVLAPVRPD